MTRATADMSEIWAVLLFNAGVATGLVYLPKSAIFADKKPSEENRLPMFLAVTCILLMSANIALGLGFWHGAALFRWAAQISASAFFASAAGYAACSIALMKSLRRRSP